MESNGGEINNLLGNLRITNEGIESRNLDIVSEMINETGDDRSHIQPDDKVVLVVEDDLRFGKIVIDKAHENGLKAIVATNYLEVFDFINRFSPIAITLDVKLPETSGWKVIDLLRNDLNLSPHSYSRYFRRRKQSACFKTWSEKLLAETT